MELRNDQPHIHRSMAPVIKLERCDKIWKTLQLIRSMQDKHIEDIQHWIKREPVAEKEILSVGSPMIFIPDKSLPLNLIGEPNLPTPHIKYQPIFNNGNELFPQFQLAEKSRVVLHHCEVCSTEFANHKRLVEHQETVHGIILQKKAIVRREKVSIKPGVLTTAKNSVQLCSHVESNKKSVADENVDLRFTAKSPLLQADIIQCKLCSRFYKNIKKHMVEYHKISSVGVLNQVAEENLETVNHLNPNVEYKSLNSDLPQIREKIAEQTKQSKPQIANNRNQNTTIKSPLKRKSNAPSSGFRKKLRSGNPQEGELNMGMTNELFKCETCDSKHVTLAALAKHSDTHKTASENKQYKQDSQRTNLTNESIDLELKRSANQQILERSQFAQDHDNNNIDHKVPRTRSSFTKQRSSSLDALQNVDSIPSVKRVKTKFSCKCPPGLSLRNTSTFVSHNSDCKFANVSCTRKSSETRSGTDKDSGLSITIKKKNNSYEIVSKDGSDEEPSRDGQDIKQTEFCEDSTDSSSDNSDGSEFDDQPTHLISDNLNYSDNHSVLKLELAEEDVDVDIEDPFQENVKTADKKNGDKICPTIDSKVPFLRVLCKRFLIQQGFLPQEHATYKCRVCNLWLGSKEALSMHIERHKKVMKRSCPCGMNFHGMSALNDHITAMHPICMSCQYCKEKYTSVTQLDEHICIVQQGAPYIAEDKYSCPNCNVIFNNDVLLDRHLQSEHFDPSLPFQCHQCLEKFPDKIARSVHSYKTHMQRAVCSLCNQRSQTIQINQKHEAYHRGIGFPCHKCRKAYSSKKYLLKHSRNVHNGFSNVNINCFLCQKSIKIKSFKKHVRKHTSSFKCEMCDHVSTDAHLEIHVNETHGHKNYPYKTCKVCSKSFLSKMQLERHIMIEKSVMNVLYKDA